MTNFFYQSSPWILPALMLIVLGLAIELPYRFRGFLSSSVTNLDPVNALQAALFTLSAFVLGLSFSQASARFDSRRGIVVTEANAIGTTWLRAVQLESAQSRRFRKILVDDTAAILGTYENKTGSASYQQMVDRTNHDQDILWRIASSALRKRGTAALSQLTLSLNDMIDIVAQQRQSFASYVPTAIVVLTLCLVTLAALSLGLRFALQGSRPVIMSAVYVIAYVIVIEMMIDYDRPSRGFVTVSLTPMTTQLELMRHSP